MEIKPLSKNKYEKLIAKCQNKNCKNHLKMINKINSGINEQTTATQTLTFTKKRMQKDGCAVLWQQREARQWR